MSVPFDWRPAILVIKQRQPSPYGYYDAQTYVSHSQTALCFERVDLWFPESTARGHVAHRHWKRVGDWPGAVPDGVIVCGYRCPKCLKIFICAEWEGYQHECTEAE